MAVPGNDAQRYERYERVLKAIMADAAFSLTGLRSACTAVRPAFVTRVVKLLVADGYLEQSGPKSRPSFRWSAHRTGFCASRWIDSKIYNDRITRAPVADRPRERLVAHGPAELRTAELLAILIRSGRAGESALKAGEKIAARYSDRLEQLADAGRGELKAISPAVADTAYCQIMAGIELGRRIERAAQERKTQSDPRIRGTADAIAYCQQEFRRLVGIKFLDHIIVARDGCVSIREYQRE